MKIINQHTVQAVLDALEIGDRVIVPKSSIKLIQHHAIYLGLDSGEHWFIENKESIGVRVVTSGVFFKDVIKITKIKRFEPKSEYNRNDLVEFALTKVGAKYKLVNYNCESFANQIQNRVTRSRQAENGVILGVITTLAIFISVIIAGSKSK